MKTLKISIKNFLSIPLIILALAAALTFFSAHALAAKATSTDVCKDTTNSAGKVSNAEIQKCLDQSQIVVDLQNIVNFLSAAVGIVVIAVIILGGVQYTLAGDNATAISAAKTRITNGLIALAAFIFTFAFLQWLIPGGIFS